MASAHARILNSKDPASVQRYKELLGQYFDDHNIDERAQASKAINEIKTLTDHLIHLDNDIMRGMLSAEKGCTNRQLYPWSPILMYAKAVHTYWLLWKWEIDHKHDYSTQRQQVCDRTPDSRPNETIPSQSKVKRELKEARQNITDI